MHVSLIIDVRPSALKTLVEYKCVFCCIRFQWETVTILVVYARAITKK